MEQPSSGAEAPRRTHALSAANYDVLATQYSNLHGQVSTLEQRVTQLDSSLSDKIDRTQQQILNVVGRQIDAISTKFDQQQAAFASFMNASRPNIFGWVGAITGVCAVLLAIGGVVGSLAKVPVDQTLTLHTQQIADAATKDELTKALSATKARFERVDVELDDKIGTREFTLFVKMMDERYENYKHDRAKAESEVAEVRTTEVSRAEHQAHWDSQTATDNRMASQITSDEAQYAQKLAEIERELHAFSWGDQIKSLFTLYQELSSRIFTMTSGAISAPPIIVPPSGNGNGSGAKP
jgi:hypothetical protein